MKKTILLLMITISLHSFSQENSMAEWNSLLNNKSISQMDINNYAPNFPILKEYKSSEELNKNLKKWIKKYRNEFDQLENKYDFSNDFSLVYLGIFSSKDYENYMHSQNENSWMEMIDASKISDRRLIEVAPNFPVYEVNISNEEYDMKIVWWQTLYSHEYENLINAPEITALNPYYKDYMDVIKVPYFIGPLKSLDKPIKSNTGNQFNDDLNFELELMNWYFIFEPNQFIKNFGFEPVFSEGFDAESYRESNIAEVTHHLNIEK